MAGKDRGSSGGEQESGAGKENEWRSFARRLEGYMPDMVKRAASNGLNSFLQTEEGVRTLINAVVPKEAFGVIADQLEKSRDDVVRLITAEFREFLNRIDLPHEIQRVLTSLSVEVKTEIRFVPNDRAVVRPSVKTKTRVKSTRTKDGEGAAKKAPRKRGFSRKKESEETPKAPEGE